MDTISNGAKGGNLRRRGSSLWPWVIIAAATTMIAVTRSKMRQRRHAEACKDCSKDSEDRDEERLFEISIPSFTKVRKSLTTPLDLLPRVFPSLRKADDHSSADETEQTEPTESSFTEFDSAHFEEPNTEMEPFKVQRITI